MSQVLKGSSLKEQEPLLRKFAEREGYLVKKVFKDAGKTATKIVGRYDLYAALNYLKEDTSISAFIVQDTDRLARQENDHFAIRHYLKKLGVKLVSMNQPGINDSAEGQLLDTIMAGVNAFQSRMTGRKVSQVMERLAEQGNTVRQAPLGYMNLKYDDDGGKCLKVDFDPKAAPLVKEAAQKTA